PAGAALMLQGEPGIGKTALWNEACERGRRRGYRLLSARPGELERTLAYAALGDLLEEVIDEALLSLPSARRSALERAVLHVDEAGTAPDQHAVALALRDALRVVATTPLVLAIDDVQWLDPSSATALTFALRRLGETRVGLLTTMRIGEAGDGGLANVGPTTQTIRLSPLDSRALDALLRNGPRRSVPTTARRVVARTAASRPFIRPE